MAPGSRMTPLDIAAAEVVDAIAAAAEPRATTIRILQVELMRRARRSDVDAEEAVDAAIAAFVQAALDGRVRTETAGAYVARALRNQLIDAHRRETTSTGARREISSLDWGNVLGYADDQTLARLLDAQAAKSDVERGLSSAADEGQFTIVRVVTQWLVMAERSGVEEPSSRAVAEALGISHSTVNEAIRTFRASYLPGGGSNP